MEDIEIDTTRYDKAEQRRESKFGLHYKWIALSNTTLGSLMAAIDQSIVLISLPAIFDGLGVNPLVPGNSDLLLWLLLGYTIVSSVTVVTIGRLSDIFGRVKIYNFGFLVFTIASIMLSVSSYYVHGTSGALSLVILRIFQGLGGGFIFANSAAILTDAFPHNERGKAMGFNQIAFIAGSLLGLLVGGVLSTIDWHLIFLISVPVGIAGTVWAYVALHEIATIRRNQKLDVFGNAAFALGLMCILLSTTYGLAPYKNQSMGWSNPAVVGGFIAGLAFLSAFVFIEMRVKDPMFRLWLFRIRAFSAGIVSMLLAGIARGGLQLMLIIWLQGVWLPLHGISIENAPFEAAVLMSPIVVGFLLTGPLSGYLSDKYGARFFTTAGMLINTVGFFMLSGLPVNFDYAYFAAIIFVMGIGQGMFAAPNTTAIMNSVPAEHRGVSSGMRATFVNVSQSFSLAIFFSLLVLGISSDLSSSLYNGLMAENVSSSVALMASNLAPSSALFAMQLGYNPIKAILPSNVIAVLPAQNANTVLGTGFFPSLLSAPFISGIHKVLFFGAVLTFIAAVISGLRGKRYVHSRS